jgi:hypothetical protein
MWQKNALRLVGATVVAGVAVAVGACADCRNVETRELGIECNADASFQGELHFDSAGTYRTFLSDRCLPGEDAAAIDAIVGDVDFGTEAVFVARGARAGVSRCIEARAAETVEACGEGLKIVFDDVESADPVCPGDWTIALAMPRQELRSALDADE